MVQKKHAVEDNLRIGTGAIGEVKFENESIFCLSPDLVVRRGLAYVPEGGRVFSNMTVLEKPDDGRIQQPRYPQDRCSRGDLYPVPDIEKSQCSVCRTLSGGERQMLPIGEGWFHAPNDPA